MTVEWLAGFDQEQRQRARKAKKTDASCGLWHVQLAVAADACPLRTCNAISGGGEERSKMRAPPIPFSQLHEALPMCGG